MKLPGAIDHQVVFLQLIGLPVYFCNHGAAVHIGQLKIGVLFAIETVSGIADGVVISKNFIDPYAGQNALEFVRGRKCFDNGCIVCIGDHLAGNVGCYGYKCKINIGPKLYQPVHGKYFKGAGFQTIRDNQGGHTFLHFQKDFAVKAIDGADIPLGDNVPVGADSVRILKLQRILINGAIFFK